MAWGDLLSNQMVSYTDAQGGGFTLQTGQSPVTSNQCMTKSDATTIYFLDTNYLVGYASNQLIPKSVWVASTLTYTYYGQFYNIDPCTGVTNYYNGSDGNWYSSPDGLVFTDATDEIVAQYDSFNGFDFTYNTYNLVYGGTFNFFGQITSPCPPFL